MSRIAAVTRMPSALSSGLSMISIGNSLPSLRRPMSSIPVPICCASASSAERRRVGDQPLGEALRNDVLHLLPEQLVAAVAELLLRLHVQQHDLAALVHHHHRIRRRLQQPAVPALHLRQMLLRGLAHADVADRRRHQDAFGAFQRAQHDLDRETRCRPCAAPMSSIPVPICCASASAADRECRRRSAVRRSPSGMMFFTFCPSSSSRR